MRIGYYYFFIELTLLDALHTQQDLLISFKNLYSNYTGSAQAIVIAAIITKYNITLKFSCFIRDNVLNNNNKLI